MDRGASRARRPPSGCRGAARVPGRNTVRRHARRGGPTSADVPVVRGGAARRAAIRRGGAGGPSSGPTTALDDRMARPRALASRRRIRRRARGARGGRPAASCQDRAAAHDAACTRPRGARSPRRHSCRLEHHGRRRPSRQRSDSREAPPPRSRAPPRRRRSWTCTRSRSRSRSPSRSARPASRSASATRPAPASCCSASPHRRATAPSSRSFPPAGSRWAAGGTSRCGRPVPSRRRHGTSRSTSRAGCAIDLAEGPLLPRWHGPREPLARRARGARPGVHAVRPPAQSRGPAARAHPARRGGARSGRDRGVDGGEPGLHPAHATRARLRRRRRRDDLQGIPARRRLPSPVHGRALSARRRPARVLLAAELRRAARGRALRRGRRALDVSRDRGSDLRRLAPSRPIPARAAVRSIVPRARRPIACRTATGRSSSIPTPSRSRRRPSPGGWARRGSHTSSSRPRPATTPAAGKTIAGRSIPISVSSTCHALRWYACARSSSCRTTSSCAR